ncbi:hypothetical protein TWF788_010963 [Orbilia oligospora]|uniref:Uncharacterized protein n=1 Tax=Orbilia oligospora TaxID=2813651 RepID=A0A7C8KQ31_ORBOL|nr:hypothetical protein TWF788_010963 [Orbilia oligospora]
MANSEPIYNIARKCEKLFNEYTPNDPPSVIDSLLQDYQQRFLAWTAYMGVFADTSISLDRRLKDQPDICDLIIRLFDILEEALDHLTSRNEFPKSPTDAMDLDSNGSCDESDDSLDTNDLIEDIETSLARLSHLGTMIRKYSTTSRSARIRSFAEQSNLSAFENLARLVVDTLYPGANESLRIQLARSMFETCASVLYKRSHQQKMNTPRLIQEPRVPTVNEEPQETAPHADKMKTLSISDPLSLDVQKSPHRANQIGESTALESVPSALDSLRTKVLKKMLDSPSKIESDCGISSVQVGKVTYPRPPQTGDSDYLPTLTKTLSLTAMPESQESSVDEQDVESPEISMARHIAEHLQVSMFLTIRLIRCQSQDGESIKCEESRVVDSGGRSTTISRSFSSSWVSSPRAATMRRCSPHPIFTATDNFDESASGGNQKTTYYDDSDSEQDHLTAWENDLLIKEGDEWEWEWGEQEGREEDQTLKKKDEVFGEEGDGLEKEVEASQAVPGEASSRYSEAFKEISFRTMNTSLTKYLRFRHPEFPLREHPHDP